MLKYYETNWQNKEGLEVHSYEVTFAEVKSQSTIEDQKERAERLSLVKIFHNNERDRFLEISERFQKNDEHFYYHKDRKFHTTLLGLPVIDSAYYGAIEEKIEQFSEEMGANMNVKFDLIRLGTKYQNGSTLKPVSGVSNGTVIAFGDKVYNAGFTAFGNKLASFLSKYEDLSYTLGRKFRRRFPTVWCTMGHYTTDFRITSEHEKLFNQYKVLDDDYFHLSCSELELGKSSYKDLRDWRLIEKFSIKPETE
jgi:hypothetical protein